MRSKRFQLLKLVFLLALAVLSGVIFIPRSYNVTQWSVREGTQYWDLPTGSRIGYTLVAANGIRKPYPIIFLQGGPGGFISDLNISTLTPLSEEGYDIYLYDQIGSGASDRLANIRDYTADRHKRDLEEIVKIIGADKVILIGQSWGACLATLFIAEHPEMVERVVFTGAASILPVREELRSKIPPDSLNLREPVYSNEEANEKSQNMRTRVVAFFARTFGVKLASDSEADDFQTLLNEELNKVTVCDSSRALKAGGGGGFYAQIMTVRSFSKLSDPRPNLRGLNIPFLFMRGQCDNQPWGFLNEYLELFPNHQLKIIPGAGHSISVEQPDLYLETIRDFLDLSWAPTAVPNSTIH